MNPHKSDDDLSIPDFCRIPQDVRNKAWERNPPKPFKLLNSAHDEAEAAAIAARHEAIRREKSARKIVRLKNLLARKADRGAKPKDYDPERHRWNPARGRFEVDPLVLLREQWAEQERRAASPLVEMRMTAGATHIAPAAGKRTRKTVSAGAGGPVSRGTSPDDLAAQVAAQPDLKVFAQANGCWDDRYDRLPNPGLVRMNVLNRLRAKVKKGHRVIWTQTLT